MTRTFAPDDKAAAPRAAPARTRHKGGVSETAPHDSALRHVDGGAKYIDDMSVPAGCLHLALVTSPWAHARITAIDSSRALEMRGVATVVTAADIPGENDMAPVVPGEPLLPPEIAEYVGHPVAAVAADDVETARAAAKLVEVQGDALEPVIELDDAIAREHYLLPSIVFQRGDPGPELPKAPRRLQGGTRVGAQDHFYLETQVALAVPQEDDEMLVYSGTQHPTEVQHIVAHLLAVPHAAVQVEVRRMGGAFGGKESQASLVAGLAAVAAHKSGRPVKLRLDRDSDMLVTGKRHAFRLDWDVGFDDDGRILAVDMQLAGQCGWSVDLSPGVLSRALSHADNAYYYPHVRLTGLFCKTNTQSNTAFRGFGGPQGMLAAEAMLDAIARSVDKDPLEVRRLNLYSAPDRLLTPYHQTVEHFRIPEMIDQLVASSDYARRRAEIDRFNADNEVIKRGLALTPVKFGVSFNKPEMNQAGALVNVYTDGSVALNHGGTEMGQGVFVKVAQVVAEVFGIDLTHAGTLGGIATIGFGELAQACHQARVSLSSTGYYRTPKIHFDRETNRGRPFFYYAHGVAVSEVAIDTLTGEWKPLRTDILHDVGNSLNPGVDRGQIEGGFIQGLGWLTMEECVWDAEGRLLTHAPSTYKIPTARDVPRDLRVDLLANAPNEEATVFRSKAVGEPPLMLANSVWLALRDAIHACGPGGRAAPLDAPATPEKILRAVETVRA